MITPIGLSGVTTGLMGLAVVLGTITVAIAFLNWRNYRGSTYGNALLVFTIGWAAVEIHSLRELLFYLSGGRNFPTFTAASLTTLGVILVAFSYYLIYREEE